ncbi:hypothetical protein [Wolbachia endosymbiont of Ctenocephalides felis wCfeT]|uniref:hypothetical protein n=1 Tax=Wolbachia endosymbiont of Ctenocephalides felis wCfeT TaxID=2732593 RepID=UPI001447F4BA|nr:hypothetical protein [Wolbachia endosymbiont of Ctenocephalides felis wCfeT]
MAKRILNEDYGRQEKEDVYEMFEQLARSSNDNLLFLCKKFIEQCDGDQQEKERLISIHDEVMKEKGGPTAPIGEEASAPVFDDSFYSEIGSGVRKIPDLCLGVSNKTKALVVIQQIQKGYESMLGVAEGAVIKGSLQACNASGASFNIYYSSDSIVDVTKIAVEAKNLKISGGLVQIGDSEVKVEVKDGMRNYTHISEGGDITLTFETSLGKLEVRLYSGRGGIINVEVYDQEKFNQLLDSGEEIGRNCRLGGLPVIQAIQEGCLEVEAHDQEDSSQLLNSKEEVERSFQLDESSKEIKRTSEHARSFDTWSDVYQQALTGIEGEDFDWGQVSAVGEP